MQCRFYYSIDKIADGDSIVSGHELQLLVCQVIED